ncbi:MAG: hypothetical protein IKZ44_03385 [Clostridia bacterium]|nr:hypothetical protein [Clostridia bacterium]
MKRVWKRILVLFIALLFSVGCTQSGQTVDPAAGSTVTSETVEPTAVPTEEPTPAPTEEPTPVPTEAPGPFSADYELLWEILETDYPYLDYLRDKGVDVDGVRETYAKLTNNAANVNAFAEIVGKVFASLKNTAHLYLVPQSLFSDMYGYVVLSSEGKDSLFLEPWREDLMRAAEAGYYTPPKTYSSSSSAYGLFPKVTVQYYDDCKTLCFLVPTFYPSTIERDCDLFEKTMMQYPEAENIIFDITANSGGSDAYWRAVIVAPFGQDYTFRWRNFYKDSAYNDRIVGEWFEIHNTSEAENAPAWATAYGLDKFFCSMDLEVTGREAIQSSAKRWVLVDDTVYSSSESFACFCKATGWATVVGTQTGGDGLGFDPVVRLLPDSGLLFRFSMAAGENADGTMNIEGTTPDVILETADVAHLLELIRAEQTH